MNVPQSFRSLGTFFEKMVVGGLHFFVRKAGRSAFFVSFGRKMTVCTETRFLCGIFYLENGWRYS